jgi:hypothetical protein
MVWGGGGGHANEEACCGQITFFFYLTKHWGHDPFLPPHQLPSRPLPHPVVFLWFLAIFSDITNTITLNLPWPVINTTIFIKWAQSITMTEVCSISSFITAFHTRFFVPFQEKMTPTSRGTTKVRLYDREFKLFIILSKFAICSGCWVIWNTQYYIHKWNNRNLAKGEKMFDILGYVIPIERLFCEAGFRRCVSLKKLGG